MLTFRSIKILDLIKGKSILIEKPVSRFFLLQHEYNLFFCRLYFCMPFQVGAENDLLYRLHQKQLSRGEFFSYPMKLKLQVQTSGPEPMLVRLNTLDQQCWGPSVFNPRLTKGLLSQSVLNKPATATIPSRGEFLGHFMKGRPLLVKLNAPTSSVPALQVLNRGLRHMTCSKYQAQAEWKQYNLGSKSQNIHRGHYRVEPVCLSQTKSIENKEMKNQDNQ